jgi:hypothetical protein
LSALSSPWEKKKVAVGWGSNQKNYIYYRKTENITVLDVLR